jgi:tRNA modification GTPase
MHDLNDTIAAVSSPSGGVRSIVRVSGPQAMSVCEQLAGISYLESEISNPRIVSGHVRIADGLTIDARLYLFFSPHSYTGDDLVEIHIDASEAIVAALVQSLLALGLRAANPGEFTARAYLNGKLDLAQAEAVNEIIVSSNKLQLDAAEGLLAGRLKQTVESVRSELLDCLSLVEAGLDFADEQIGPLGQVESKLARILERLETLLAESIRCQTLVDLPAVGIAGAPNAGKSSLLNALLGRPRSIVSHEPMTTRDVLTGVLTADRFQCVLFDCAGLVTDCNDSLNALAQQAAVEALRDCEVVLFCVDATKADWRDEIAIRNLIRPKHVVYVATKCDLPANMAALSEVFSADFLPTSSKTREGLTNLIGEIRNVIQRESASTEGSSSAVAMTARHRQMVADSIGNTRQAVAEMKSGHDEVAAMMIRAGYQALMQVEQQHLDEQVLDRIFSRFCIGK